MTPNESKRLEMAQHDSKWLEMAQKMLHHSKKKFKTGQKVTKKKPRLKS